MGIILKGKCRSIFFLWLLALLLSSCRQGLHREARLAMSTVLTVTVSGPEPDWGELFEYAERLADQFDYREPASPVAELNRRGRARLEQPVLGVLETALEVAGQSGGAFDPTVLPLTRLWAFETGGRVPAEEEILEARKRVGYRSLRLEADGEASIPGGYGLDLGGIAKGAVVDGLGRWLKGRGYDNFLIDAGGDIGISGTKDGRPWKIAIRHPRNSEGVLGILPLGGRGGESAIVTSGDYERYFEAGGRRYHHILDPQTGYPSRDLVSVTVITSSCAEADALATAAFVLGMERGLSFLEEIEGAEGLLIGERGGSLFARATSGFPLDPSELDL